MRVKCHMKFHLLWKPISFVVHTNAIVFLKRMFILFFIHNAGFSMLSTPLFTRRLVRMVLYFSSLELNHKHLFGSEICSRLIKQMNKKILTSIIYRWQKIGYLTCFHCLTNIWFPLPIQSGIYTKLQIMIH